MPESRSYSTITLDSASGYNDHLQFTGHEEGRTRAVCQAADPDVFDHFEYDYMIKDHLGNVRMVLTEELKTDLYPAATMEDVADKTNLNDPDNYIPYYSSSDYTDDPTVRYPVSSISGYPSVSGNSYVAKTRGDAQKTGPAILLKVMAGDQFNVRADSWWKSAGSPSGTTSPLADIVAALITGAPGVSSGKVAVNELTQTVLNPEITDFLSDPDRVYDAGKPKAYLNWVFLDEQFRYVDGGSSAEQVGGISGSATPYQHVHDGIVAEKNGYLYVYTSNETNNIDVFFDNLQVTHVRGSLLEESHYYPFGLTMAGISSKALAFGGPENKKKFNGIEHNTDLGLNVYDALYRNLDPQIGRWWQIDPKPNEFESPYVAMGNNPIFKFDILGDTVYNANGDDDATIQNRISEGLNLKKGQANPFAFNDDGILGVNKKAYNALSKEQKKLAKNIVDAIGSKDLLEIQLVDAGETLETHTVKDLQPDQEMLIGGKSYKNGDEVPVTIVDYGGGRVKPPVKDGNGPGSDLIVAQIVRGENSATVQGIGNVQVSNPSYVVTFHEAFGHFVYHYINNSPTQNKQTIDYENGVRQLRGLPLRTGNDHPKDQ